jgi:chorismate synthase
MLGNTFGTLFRVSSFGESHGPALGVLIDGCPAGLELDLEQIRSELDRRRPGQSKLVTPRKELDEFEILSGVFEGKTTGMPLMILTYNSDVKSKDYSAIKDLFRPGHADFTYFAKYRHRDYRGGGRSSARETVARVMAGAIAKQLLAQVGIEIRGGVVRVGAVAAKRYDWAKVEESEIRSVDPDMVEAMREEIQRARKDRDSVGGTIEIQAIGVPPGLGEPVFGKLDAAIAGAIMSIPATKGVEFGSGFDSASSRGSELNDEMFPDGFSSNHHGGILGGISSGAPIVVRFAVKPTSSIPQFKNSVDKEFNAQNIETKGRHDPCVALRAVPIAESMLALVLLDYWLQDRAQQALRAEYDPIESIRYGMSPSALEESSDE